MLNHSIDCLDSNSDFNKFTMVSCLGFESSNKSGAVNNGLNNIESNVKMNIETHVSGSVVGIKDSMIDAQREPKKRGPKKSWVNSSWSSNGTIKLRRTKEILLLITILKNFILDLPTSGRICFDFDQL